ncbi:hypothetical protein BP5796_11838 [Coleophoma crateriformis]|uniref:DUF1479-domain-containing protein n=1 Tax=Coleophoma crateriformis TaxID=565419 RepID=A0A3D8QEG1_9HELO|nr:hypothetical protein BP5796_11838 [Coleophoma crateriformis]
MPGALKVWPSWPEFTLKTAELDPSYRGYKKAIEAEYGAEALTASWLAVCKKLETVTDEIADKGTSVIPVLDFAEVKEGLSEQRKAEMRDRGCFVVRGVIEKEVVDGWFGDLKQYVADNRADIGGWPKETPFVLRLFWSPTQIKARSHPHSLLLQRTLNSLWHSNTLPSFAQPLSYADAVRIRPPKIPFFGLGPHIDAGSLSRWADPTYRKAYAAIFEGRPHEHDAYDLDARVEAKQALFEGSAHSSVLRAFQGWTALTDAGPGEGSLLLYPDLKTVIAYLLLRPFFKEPENKADIMDPTKWTFDTDSDWFPGTWQADSQNLSESSHPHLRLRDCMVNIPAMRAGDSVWWHADMCHAVEVEHMGQGDSSVAYVAATPSTPENERYMRAQLQDFLKGVAPGDYSGKGELGFKGWVGEAGILAGEEGRKAAGFEL